MSTPADGDVVQAAFHGTLNSTLIVNTMHYVLKFDTGITGNEPAATDIATQIDSKLRTAYKAVCTVGMTLDSLVIRKEVLDSNVDIPYEGSVAIGQAGTLAASDTLLPLGLCNHLKIKTNAAVRSGHGGMFLPPPRSSAFLASQGFWSSGGAYWTGSNALAALLDDIIQVTVLSVNAWHLTPVVYSRTRRKRGDANWWFQVTQVSGDFTPHWLRSRMTAP